MGLMKSLSTRIEEICRLCDSPRTKCSKCKISMRTPKGVVLISGLTKEVMELETLEGKEE